MQLMVVGHQELVKRSQNFMPEPVILTAHQPVYLPWLGLFHKIALADKFCFFDDVQYQPKGWNNRNKIKFSNGQTNWLTVPVKRSGYREKSFIDIEINNDIPWRRKHSISIKNNYSRAKYYNLYSDGLMEFYKKEWKYLVNLNYEMLLFFLEELGLNIPVVRMSNYLFKGRKSDLVLDMCSQFEADVYIFGELGEKYADKENFMKKGIALYFQNYNHPEYKQLHGSFFSNLSIIDLLFNCGPDTLNILMDRNINRAKLIESIRMKTN